MSEEPAVVLDWLRRLKWSLASIPSPEREDIYEEARSHLREMLAKGVTPAQAISGFGSPENYAHHFVEEMEISGALASQHTGAMASIVARRIHRSLMAAVAGVVLLVLGALVFASLAMLFFKLGDPIHTGLWRNAHEFFIGKIDSPMTATDLLGDWIYPLTVAVVALSWIAGRFVLLWAIRRLARNR